jgi:hypothetical protein
LKHQWERAWASWLEDATRSWPERGILFDERGKLHPRAKPADALVSSLIEDLPELKATADWFAEIGRVVPDADSLEYWPSDIPSPPEVDPAALEAIQVVHARLEVLFLAAEMLLKHAEAARSLRHTKAMVGGSP